MKMVAMTSDTPSYTCPFCSAVSHHPRDLEERFCDHCKQWADDWSGKRPQGFGTTLEDSVSLGAAKARLRAMQGRLR